jgi:hypothetical protein
MNACNLLITYNVHKICSAYFTYSSMFILNCFICIIIYIYSLLQVWYTHSNNINHKTYRIFNSTSVGFIVYNIIRNKYMYEKLLCCSLLKKFVNKTGNWKIINCWNNYKYILHNVKDVLPWSYIFSEFNINLSILRKGIRIFRNILK